MKKMEQVERTEEKINGSAFTMAQLLKYKNETEGPIGTKGSEYGKESITFGYIKNGKFVDKNNIEYNINRSFAVRMGYNLKFVWENGEPKKDEVYAVISDDLIVDPKISVSVNVANKLLDFIEKEFFENKKNKPSVREINKKLLTLK